MYPSVASPPKSFTLLRFRHSASRGVRESFREVYGILVPQVQASRKHTFFTVYKGAREHRDLPAHDSPRRRPRQPPRAAAHGRTDPPRLRRGPRRTGRASPSTARSLAAAAPPQASDRLSVRSGVRLEGTLTLPAFSLSARDRSGVARAGLPGGCRRRCRPSLAFPPTRVMRESPL